MLGTLRATPRTRLRASHTEAAGRDCGLNSESDLMRHALARIIHGELRYELMSGDEVFDLA